MGETPSEFQRRWSASGAPRIPGCFVFMWGLAETGETDETARQEKRRGGPAS